MMPRLLVLLPASAFAACSFFGCSSDPADGEGKADAADAAPPPPDAADAAPAPAGPSCRAIHERESAAPSGTYSLVTDGGSVQAYCDMDSYEGGWTLVTPKMIVEDIATQDATPASPAHVDVTRGTDAHGGVTYALSTTIMNCGADRTKPGPSHYFLVGELDGWTQIMATYELSGAASCWDIFGSPTLPQKMNVSAFDARLDKIGPQTNMSRDPSGKAIPYDGRVTACDEVSANFWREPYKDAPKNARVVLRRTAQGSPAGLAIAADCGLPAWKITSIHVR